MNSITSKFCRRLCIYVGLPVFISALGAISACTTTNEESKLNKPSAESTLHSSDPERAKIRLQLGVSYLQQDQLATALKELNNAISIDPNLTDAYAVRALVHMQMRNDELAEQDFSKVLRMDPNNPENLSNYGWFLCQSGKEKQAVEFFDRAIKDRKYTQPVKALNNAGLCSLKMKDDVAAENYFLQSLRLDANNPTTNLNLARLSYKKHDWTNAQFYINRIVKDEGSTSEIMWLAMKINHQLNDQGAVANLAGRLRSRFPDSSEYALFERGAFDE